MGVTTLTTSADVWRTLDGMYTTRTRARSVNTRIALATTRKGASTMTEFYFKMKSYADEMAASGQNLGDEEFVAYVLTGLDEEIYNSFVSSIVTRVEPISSAELYSQMLAFELRLMKQAANTSYTSSSANAASRERGAPWTRGGSPSRGRGRSSGSGRGSSSRRSRGGYNNNNNYSRRSSGGVPSDATGGHDHPRCQVCKKVGHEADICWHRYDDSYAPDNRAANMASSSGADQNWYLDSGSTDHITGELEQLTMHQQYNGNKQIRAANGAGMDIAHVGQSVIPTPTHPLHLNQVIHVPNAHKQLVSIQRFTLDNNTFIELHPYSFLIKDQVTKQVLLHGPCRGGLYPLHLISPTVHKLILSAIKSSSQRWHLCLGHPSRDIVLRVIKSNSLSCSSFESSDSVCDACLQVKAHQLPYPQSSRQSTAPLQLVFSDVWGPTIDFFGNKKYYVSFIDDYSKFI
jgi:hypothetical protein